MKQSSETFILYEIFFYFFSFTFTYSTFFPNDGIFSAIFAQLSGEATQKWTVTFSASHFVDEC